MLRTLCLGALLLASGAWAQPAADSEIRVLLAEALADTRVAAPGAHRGFVDGRLAFETRFALSWPLEARNGRLYIGDAAFGHTLRLEALGDTLLGWGGARYRGALELRAAGDRVQVVNALDLEDYLRGVVPAEMPASWPAEALKAQAVAARSYVLAAREPGLAYDVCATVMCQVYQGAEAETPATDEAIAATRGLVLVFDGALAKTYYHSHSGGHLASSLEVWGYAAPYLPGHADAASPPPHHLWEFQLGPAAMAHALATSGRSVGAVQRLEILDYSASGRATRAVISGERARVVLQGSELTRVLRDAGLKSTRFVMRAPLVAQGGGYGHGVGMSQYGAFSLASTGWRFEDILGFYYPGTRLEPLQTRRQQGAQADEKNVRCLAIAAVSLC